MFVSPVRPDSRTETPPPQLPRCLPSSRRRSPARHPPAWPARTPCAASPPSPHARTGPDPPVLLGLRLDVEPPPQVLQTDGRGCHAAPAFHVVGGVANQ